MKTPSKYLKFKRRPRSSKPYRSVQGRPLLMNDFCTSGANICGVGITVLSYQDLQ